MNQKQTIAEAGTPDSSFGTNGEIRLPLQGTTGSKYSVLEVANNKFIITSDPEGALPVVVSRLNTDGTIDDSYGDGGHTFIHFGRDERFTNPVLHQHPIGGWFLTGNLSRDFRNGLVIVHQFEDGTIDRDFGVNGESYIRYEELAAPVQQEAAKAPAGRLSDLIPDQQPSRNTWSAWHSCGVLPDGKIVVSVNAMDLNDALTGMVLCLNPDGSLNDSFDGKGFTLIELDGIEHKKNHVSTLVVQEDGKIVITGSFTPTDADLNKAVFVLRYLQTGQLDDEFANKGVAVIPLSVGEGGANIDGLSVKEEDGAIAIAGGVYRQSKLKGWVTVLNANGSTNLVFNHGQILYSDSLQGELQWEYCKWQKNSSLLVSGTGGHRGHGFNQSIVFARYLSNGVPDSLFNKTGWTAYTNIDGNPVLQESLVMKDQRIVAMGENTLKTGGYLIRLHG